MKFESFYKKTAPFYKHLKEHQSEIVAEKFLRNSFRVYVINELSEGDILKILINGIDQKFDSEKIMLKTDLYIEEFDVNTDNLDKLIKLLGGILK